MDRSHKNLPALNQRIRGWIARLLEVPGVVSFVAYRTADGTSPDTTTILEFRTLEEARKAVASEPVKSVVQELRSVGAFAKVAVAVRSPFTPEPIRA